MDAAPDVGDLYDNGNTPLTDLAAEAQLLGLMLQTPQRMTEVIDILTERDFFDPLHRQFYLGLHRAYHDGCEMVDVIKIDPQYASNLMAHAETSLDPAELADRIQQIGERRAIGGSDDDRFGSEIAFKSKFGGRRWEEIGDATTPGYRWVVEDVIPMGEATLMFGDSGSGKSFVSFDIAMHIVRGLPYYGHNVEPGLVVYVAAEGALGFAKRKKAYALQHQLADDAAFPFYLITRRPDFFANDTDTAALIEEIHAVAAMYKVPLIMIVLDTLSALAPGMNENASQDISAVRRRIVRIQEEFFVSILLVHHKPKNGSTPRGHGSLTADFETTIELEVLTDKKTIEGKEVYRATARKQRDGKRGIHWEFVLPIFEVGCNKWGNAETSCVAVPYKSAVTDLSGFHANANELLFLQALYRALDEHGQPPPHGLPRSITRAVEIKHVRVAMRERVIDKDVDPAVADNRFRGAFKRAGDKLRDGAVIGVQSGLIWPTGKPVRGFNATVQVET
jgi:hypothetical protein